MDLYEFNRASLQNVGYVEAMKDAIDWDCFIFHDVDLLPENDRHWYSCSEYGARHLAVGNLYSICTQFVWIPVKILRNFNLNFAAQDKHQYRLVYPAYFGGAIAMTGEQFRKVNG